MEKIELVNVDYEAATVEKALGLTDKERDFVKHCIVFETIASPLIVGEIYGSADEAPASMRTPIAIYHNALKRLSTPIQQLFLTYIFHGVYGLIMDMGISATEYVRQANKEDEENYDDSNLMEMVQELGREKAIEGFVNSLKLIKSVRYDFDKYYEIASKGEKYDAYDMEIKEDDDMREQLTEAMEEGRAIDGSNVPDELKEMLKAKLKEELQKAKKKYKNKKDSEEGEES